MSERDKMNQGLWYDANYDTELLDERTKAEDLCFQFNNTRPSDSERKEALLRQLLPKLGEQAVVLAPFFADYGYNCVIGANTFLNHNAYLMDGAPITIGTNCFIGPNCGMYTATHPLLAEERNRGLERAKPIVIGNNVWLGASVIVLPGVTIGDDSVIGAGSIVTKDIPAGVVAIGNPCRVIRPITESDRISSDRISSSSVSSSSVSSNNEEESR